MRWEPYPDPDKKIIFPLDRKKIFGEVNDNDKKDQNKKKKGTKT